MCSCSFAEENRQNVGCTSSSRGLNVDEFLIRLIKFETTMFLTACTVLALPSHERQKLVFGKWPIMRLDNFFLRLSNSRNAAHFVYLWRQFLYKCIQKMFWIFVGLQYFLNTCILTEDAIFEARRIGSDCWPQWLKFKMAEKKIHSIGDSIVISSECTYVHHTIFLF